MTLKPCNTNIYTCIHMCIHRDLSLSLCIALFALLAFDVSNVWATPLLKEDMHVHACIIYIYIYIYI